MNVEALNVLIQCKRRYELEQVILSEKKEQDSIFNQALEKLSEAVVKKMEWRILEQDIKLFFQDSLKEEWYSLALQKKLL